ncbi:MAG TPA: 6,7-dimethyl-8-ribityllumazine synthase [Planctomycetota bacterium]
MVRILEGNEAGAGRRIAVVVADFNRDVTDALLQGCLDTLRAAGVREDDLLVVRVPGAFELPGACDRLAAAGGWHAVVALGAVIRGGTPHFDFVAGETARGLGRVALDRGVPVVFGVLTTDTLAQARHRAAHAGSAGADAIGPSSDSKTTPRSNKGVDAAKTALRMAAVYEAIG